MAAPTITPTKAKTITMDEGSNNLTFELNAEAIRLILKALTFQLERWPGGPDPREQEDLQKLRSLFYAAQLECQFNNGSDDLA